MNRRPRDVSFATLTASHINRFAERIHRHKPIVDSLSEIYSPEGMIELGTLLVLEGTERLKREREH